MVAKSGMRGNEYVINVCRGFDRAKIENVKETIQGVWNMENKITNV